MLSQSDLRGAAAMMSLLCVCVCIGSAIASQPFSEICFDSIHTAARLLISSLECLSLPPPPPPPRPVCMPRLLLCEWMGRGGIQRMHVLCGRLHVIFFLKKNLRCPPCTKSGCAYASCTCVCLCACCFAARRFCLSLQATFAGGCLLITAINLPADSGLERHVAAAPKGGWRGEVGVVKWVGRRSGREKQ